MLQWPKDHLYKNYYRLLTLAYGIQAVDECFPFSPDLRQLVNDRVEQIEAMENTLSLLAEGPSQLLDEPPPVEPEMIPVKRRFCGSHCCCSFLLLFALMSLIPISLRMVCSGSVPSMLRKYPMISSFNNTLPKEVCMTVLSFSGRTLEWVCDFEYNDM